MRSRRFWLVLLVLSAASILLLWGTAVPLGVPGEWIWSRIRSSQDGFVDQLLGWLMAATGAGAYVGFAWLGARRLARCRGGETFCWLSGLVVAGFCWLWIVQESPQSDRRMSKVAWVLYYPRSSGYFFEARYRMTGVGQFLSHYEARMAEGDVLHVGTHPPGLFVLHRGLIWLSRQSPAVNHLVLQAAPDSLHEAFATVEDNSSGSPTPLLVEDRVALWLAALLTQLAAAATVIPLFGLLRRDCSSQTSWLAVSFWPLIPALAVFLPKSDALYPCLAVAFLYVWREALVRRSPLWGLAAGLLIWFALLFSLAFLPIAALAGLLTLWEIVGCHRGQRVSEGESNPSGCPTSQQPSNERDSSTGEPPPPSADLATDGAPALGHLVSLLAWSASGFAAAVVLAWVVWDVNLLNVWWWNYHNHAGFYDQFERTYWAWLLVNPLEVVLAVGAPVAVLAATSFVRILRTGTPWRAGRRASLVCCVAVCVGLWLSGKNMGEAARLWLLLFPWVIWLATPILEPSSAGPGQTLNVHRLRPWLIVLIVQAAVCIATVTRVDGFQLENVLRI